MPGSKSSRHSRSPPPLSSCHARGRQSKYPWPWKITAGVCTRHQLHLSHYTWWVFGLFQSLRKINFKKPLGTRKNYFKIRCVCYWLCLLLWWVHLWGSDGREPLALPTAGSHGRCCVRVSTEPKQPKAISFKKKSKINSSCFEKGTEKDAGQLKIP